jgi:hypothetical protein
MEPCSGAKIQVPTRSIRLFPKPASQRPFIYLFIYLSVIYLFIYFNDENHLFTASKFRSDHEREGYLDGLWVLQVLVSCRITNINIKSTYKFQQVGSYKCIGLKLTLIILQEIPAAKLTRNEDADKHNEYLVLPSSNNGGKIKKVTLRSY